MASQGHTGTLLTRRRRVGLWLGLALALSFTFALVVLAVLGRTTAAPSARQPQPYEGTKLDGIALDFRLVDQTGTRVALSDFRGKVVALTFLDPYCSDVCPLIVQDFRQLSAAFGDQAAQIAFLAVNVNPAAGSVADVAAATEKWGINTLPNWHFLTGKRSELQPIWKAYSIAAGGPKPGRAREVQHTSGAYVIGSAGRVRWYVSTPLGEALWGSSSFGDLLHRHMRELLAET